MKIRGLVFVDVQLVNVYISRTSDATYTWQFSHMAMRTKVVIPRYLCDRCRFLNVVPSIYGLLTKSHVGPAENGAWTLRLKIANRCVVPRTSGAV